MSGWIGVDLDGTLTHYDGWRGIEHIGEPVAPMLARVKAWVERGVEVRIFTARVSVGPGDRSTMGREGVTEIIQDWLEKHGLPRLAVTNVKDFGMVELWDDRAIQVRMNTGEIVGGGI